MKTLSKTELRNLASIVCDQHKDKIRRVEINKRAYTENEIRERATMTKVERIMHDELKAFDYLQANDASAYREFEQMQQKAFSERFM